MAYRINRPYLFRQDLIEHCRRASTVRDCEAVTRIVESNARVVFNRFVIDSGQSRGAGSRVHRFCNITL